MATAVLLVDAPLPGPVNMARDEALLRSCTEPEAAPIVRFYTWSTPTISLGYFQPYAEFRKLPPPVGDLPVVRRTTGGGAILHDLELTYSIVLPIDHPLIASRPNHLYNLAHQAIIDVIGHGAGFYGTGSTACGESARRGPFFCFDRRHPLDVCVPNATAPDGLAKIAGSAQRRTRRAVLQHGSLILNSRYAQQSCACWGQLDDVDFNTATERLAPQIERVFGVAFSRTEWKPEWLDAAQTHERRYAGDEWTIGQTRLAELRST